LAAVYHCVPANTRMNTVDINVSCCGSFLFCSIDRHICMEEEILGKGGQERVHFRGQEHKRER
jgi:hypothetical protein